MAPGEIITAFIAGLAGILAVFFGREYWRSFSGLINDQKQEVFRLQDLLSAQRDRLDQIESRLHARDLQLYDLQNKLDTYSTSSKDLIQENRRLRSRIRELETKAGPPG